MDEASGRVTYPEGIQLGVAPTIRVANKAIIVRDGRLLVVGEFAFLRDYIADDHEFAALDGGQHQREAYFFCSLPPGVEPVLGTEADTRQTGIAWIPMSGLLEEPLWPKAVAPWLLSPEAARPRYLDNVT